MAPTIGAGKPYQLKDKVSIAQNGKKESRRTRYKPRMPSLLNVRTRQSSGPRKRAVASSTCACRRTLVRSKGCSKTFETIPAACEVALLSWSQLNLIFLTYTAECNVFGGAHSRRSVMNVRVGRCIHYKKKIDQGDGKRLAEMRLVVREWPIGGFS